MKAFNLIICLFILVFNHVDLNAQKWISYTNTDDVRAISVDSKGNEWFATTGGLKKFDGTNWTKYTNTNSGLHLTRLTSVAVDKQDRVWAGTSDGVSVFDGLNWVSYTYENSGNYLKNITAIQVDIHGKVWIATDGNGIFTYFDETWQSLTTNNTNIPCNAFYNMYVLDEICYFGSRCGVVVFDGTNWITYNSSNSGLFQNDVRSISADRSGRIFCGTSSLGLFIKDGTNWINYNASNSPLLTPNEDINSLMYDSINNLVWISRSSNAGLFLDTLNSNGIWGNYEIPSTLPIYYPGVQAFAINSITKTTWVGTTQGLISYKDKIKKDYIATINEPAFNGSTSIAADSSNVVWWGNYSGVSKYDGQNWSNFNKSNSPLMSNVIGIMVDENNNKWFGSNGLKMYDGINWKSYSIEKAYSMTTDGKGRKWFATLYNGFAKLENEVITYYNMNNSLLIDNLVQALDVDKDGNLWIGTYIGAQRFDGSNWVTYTKFNSGLQSGNVNDILVDKSGNIWFGCTGAVTRFDGTNWTSWSADGINGLKGDYIFDVEEDIDGTIWVGGTGISKFDGTKWITYTTKNSGLVGDYVRRISIDKWGNKWVATGDAGISFFNDKPVPPTPTISAVGATQFCDGGSLVLTSSALTGNQWYKDGVAISVNGNGQTYLANASGTYTVRVIINYLESNLSLPQSVVVLPKPIVGFAINQDKQCLNNNRFDFSNTSTIPNGYLSNSNWSFGNGISSTAANPMFSYASSGTYSVKLLVELSSGCKDSATASVTVYPDPSVSFTVNNATQELAGNSFVFTNTSSISSGSLQYNWNFGNGATSTSVSPTYSYSATGNYTVTLTATSSNGCPGSASRQVTVNATVPKSNLYANTVTCQSYLTGASNLPLLCYTTSKGKVSAISPATFNYYATITAPSSTFTMDIVQTVSISAFKFFAVKTGTAKLLTSTCGTFLSGNSPSSGQSQFKVTGAVPGRTYIISIVYETKSSIGATSSNSEIPTYTFSARVGTTVLANSTSSIKMYPNNCTGVSAPLNATLLDGMANISGGRGNVESSTDISIDVHPNPTAQLFNVGVRGKETISQGTLRVMNALGQLIEIRSGLRPGMTIQLGGNYGKGVYFIDYFNGGKRLTKTLIKD